MSVGSPVADPAEGSIDRQAPEQPPESSRARTFVIVLCWVAIVVGVVTRFLPRADLWLDEALSVNIAKLPLGDIGEALRHDGHPPLYYFLLHGWMAIGGESDWWVRALSGIFGVLAIPLGYIAGGRIARRSGSPPEWVGLASWLTAAMVAVIPYGIRYGSETRMYSLLILLVLAGYLLVDDLMRGTRSGRSEWLAAIGTALIAAALLWSQYWSMWLLATLGLVVLWRLWRPGPVGRRGSWFVLGALVGGGVLFLPWLPSLAYQSAHTGTPWGDLIRPTTVLLVTMIEFAGRAVAEPQLLSYVLVLLILVGAVGVVVRRRNPDGSVSDHIEIEPRTTPLIRYELVVLFGTLALGSVASLATSATYQSRYAAVVFPLFCVCVGAGLSVLRGIRVVAIVLSLVLVGSSVAIGLEVTSPRTQAGVVADKIVADAGDDPADAVVVTCPDQLSPATARALSERTGVQWTTIPFPTGRTPERVDWVDYAKRNEAATVDGFLAQEAGRITPDTTVYLVFTPGYNTFDAKCEGIGAALEATHTRDPAVAAEPNGEEYFENMGLWVYRPRS